MKKIERGFTVVELLIYMLIFSMLLLVLTNVFSTVLDVMSESQSRSAVLRNGEFIIARLSYDIKRAEEIVVPASVGDLGNNLKLTINSEEYDYALTGSDLTLTNNNVSNKLNGFDADIDSASFRALGYENEKKMVEISITVTSKILHNNTYETKNFKSTVGIRKHE